MFRLMITAEAKSGANAEALQKTQEITNYANESYSPYFENRGQCGTQSFGSMNRICWFGDFKSLALFEEYENKIQSDGTYMEKARTLMQLFVDGSLKQQLFRIS